MADEKQLSVNTEESTDKVTIRVSDKIKKSIDASANAAAEKILSSFWKISSPSRTLNVYGPTESDAVGRFRKAFPDQKILGKPQQLKARPPLGDVCLLHGKHDKEQAEIRSLRVQDLPSKDK